MRAPLLHNEHKEAAIQSSSPGRFPDATNCMTDLAEIFAELGISSYLDSFLEQGFDSWDTILDITESDFDALGVKLGHRRKLQRKIANSRGIASETALGSPRHTPNDEKTEEQKTGNAKTDGKDGSGQQQGAKRKYRRHPKPDENAPERPPSAYVIFSNKMREELKGRNLSFTEIAKLVGENWQNLSSGEKDPYEGQAFSAKERYNGELAEYKKTANYRDYSQYLADFKARQAQQQQVPDLEVAKRPKLEANHSTASSGTASSTTSHVGAEALTVRARVESSGSTNGQWQPPSASNPKSNIGQGSPVLPGYRDSLNSYDAAQIHEFPWRDGQRESGSNTQKLPTLASVYDRKPSYAGTPGAEMLGMTGSLQHTRRTGLGNPPPLLTSESTNRSTTSSASTASSTFYTPRTPLDNPLDRPPLTLPSLFSQKSTGSMDSQLSPFPAPSLSPQAPHMAQQSPTAILPPVDYGSSISMAPIRGYNTAPQSIVGVDRPDPRVREYALQNPTEDNNNLDPVSALLKAGEIVNRNSRAQTQTQKPPPGS